MWSQDPHIFLGMPIFMGQKWARKSVHLRFLCGHLAQKRGRCPIFIHQYGHRLGRCRIFMQTEVGWPEVEPQERAVG